MPVGAAAYISRLRAQLVAATRDNGELSAAALRDKLAQQQPPPPVRFLGQCRGSPGSRLQPSPSRSTEVRMEGTAPCLSRHFPIVVWSFGPLRCWTSPASSFVRSFVGRRQPQQEAQQRPRKRRCFSGREYPRCPDQAVLHETVRGHGGGDLASGTRRGRCLLRTGAGGEQGGALPTQRRSSRHRGVVFFAPDIRKFISIF